MKAFKVGGAVRDRLLGLAVQDTDWVVIDSSIEEMIDRGFTTVGADFPVFLHPDTGDEYALARTERKTGVGYGGFTFHVSADVTLEEDLSRRDLTINAMAENDQGEVIDPFGGRADLQAKLLRHVSPAFAEDPLRVLRVARFAARFAPQGFTVAPETLALMQNLVESGELAALKPERVWKEVSRALLEDRADVFFLTLRACGALHALFPELDALFGVVQPALHHPEIDTGVHTLMVLQQACRFQQPLAVRWAVLCHDFGKALSQIETLPAHHGHEKSGLSLVKAASERFKVPSDCLSLALIVCEYHTHVHRAFELKASTLLDLLERSDAFRRPERLDQFVAACEMDSRGRLGLENRDYPQAGYVRGAADVARAVQAQAFVEQGLQGPAIGEAIRRERLRVLKWHIQDFQSAVSRETSA